VRRLSGGERSRLALAKMLLFPAMCWRSTSRPTTWDFRRRETLEHALDGLRRNLIVVSHDRYFLDRVCRRLLVLKTARWDNRISGNYSDWREYRKRQAAAQPVPEKAPTPRPPHRRPKCPAP